MKTAGSWRLIASATRSFVAIPAVTEARQALQRSEVLKVEISSKVLLIADTATENPLGCSRSTRHDGELLHEHYSLIW